MTRFGAGTVVLAFLLAGQADAAAGQPVQTALALGNCAVSVNHVGNGTVTVINNCPTYQQLPPEERAKVDRLLRETIANRRADRIRDRRIADIKTSDEGQSEELAELREALAEALGYFRALASGNGAGEAERRAQELLERGDPSAAADLLGREAAANLNAAELNRRAAIELYLRQSTLLEVRDLVAARAAAQMALRIDSSNLDAIYRCASLANSLGRTNEALRLWQAYVAAANRGKAGSAPSEDDLHRLADVQISIADLLSDRGKIADALAAYRGGREAAEQLVTQFPENLDWKVHFVGTLDRIGGLQLQEGDVAAAEATYTEMLRIAAEYDRDRPDTALLNHLLAEASSGLGQVFDQQGKREAASAQYAALLGYVRRLVVIEPQDLSWQRNLAVSLSTVGAGDFYAGNNAKALNAFEEGLGIVERLLGGKPGNVDLLDLQATLDNQIGRVRLDLEEYPAALSSLAKAVSIAQELVRADPNSLQRKGDLANSLKYLASVQNATGDVAGSLASLREAERISEKLIAGDGSNTQFNQLLFEIELELGDRLSGDAPQEAKHYYGKAAKIAEHAASRFPQIRSWLRDAAVAHGRIGLMTNGIDEAKRRRELAKAITGLERLQRGGPYDGLDATLGFFRKTLAELK